MLLQFLAVALALACSNPQTPPPSVLVIVLDDVGVGEALPSLAEVAQRGVTFTRAYSWPVCSPTRFASLFGRYPRRVGMGDVVSAFEPQTGPSPAPDRREVCLAEALLPSHRTALFGKWHLGVASNTNRVQLFIGGLGAPASNSGPFVSGFEEWWAGNANSIAQGQGASGYIDWSRIDNHQIRNNWTGYATWEQGAMMEIWWGVTPEPKFAWLGFNAAHAPYDVPPGETPGLTTRDAYLQVLAAADVAITSALSSIDWDSTIVVVVGDNGTPEDARPPGTPTGFWKGTTFQGGVNVPLVVAVPGGVQGVVSDRLVSVVDLPATLLELVGQASRGFDDSQSFADEFGAQWIGEPERAWLMTERYDCPGGPQPQPLGYDDLCLVEQETLLPGGAVTVRLKRRIVDFDGPGPITGSDLIYDLISDPFEMNPGQFSAAPPQVRTRFNGYLASLPPRQ